VKILVSSIVDLSKTSHNRLHQFIRHLSRNHSITVLSINDWWKNSQITSAQFWWNGQDAADTYDSIYTVGDVRCIEVQANFRGETDAGVHITRFIWNADADVDHCRVTGIVEGYNEVAPVVFIGAGCDQDLIIFDCS